MAETDDIPLPVEFRPSFVKLLCSDVVASQVFYRALGFTSAGQDGAYVHMQWAPHADLFLVALPAGAPLPAPRGAGVLLCYTARPDADVDTVAQRARDARAKVDGPLVQPWHTREVIITDPDGYRINFVQPA